MATNLPAARVQQMVSNRGNNIPDQFEIYTDDGVFFQSYASIIAFKSYSEGVYLDKERWDASATTGKYRNQFLGESKKETEAKIKSGEYKLVDLNRR